ncbi:uncharacterized protein LOC115764569 isoform X1 [Drosophila novamexicana]|uniref:uncharacterized protein LOC115764569 isoform X1 n=2 Tax=Drosophila novamexicana TaxID=47314 RepID=UPI0011E5D11F|nr:uncharacterized protein LOC115764569 isoform X1 [Drosophila novamexicana]
MFDFVPSKDPINGNETLRRARRHISFLRIWNKMDCFYPEALQPNSTEMCEFVRNNPSCTYFVYHIDYLKLLFCTLNLGWDSCYVFMVALIFVMLYFVLYMIIKYFCLPNYMTLMEMLPISSYTYSFVYFGSCLFIPEYLNFWLSCPYKSVDVASLMFTKSVGDILRFFLLGIMMLCIKGYHVRSVLWWGNMSFILIGYVYLFMVVRLKYDLFGAFDLAYDNAHLMTLNAWTFLFVFNLVLLLSILLSYHKRRRQLRKTIGKESSVSKDIPSPASEMDDVGNSPLRDDLNKFQIWWSTVNGYANMKEHNKIIVICFTPLYFLLANIVPVIDKNRPMYGWCKNVNCVSFLVFPIIFINLMPDPKAWFGVFVISWILAFMVYISTHSLREPSHAALCIYSIVGMVVCSVSMDCLIGEIDNLAWQYFSLRFHGMSDLICLMFFSSGEMLCASVFLHYLIAHNLNDAAYGAVMSLITHSVYTALPLLVLHNCYTRNTYIMETAKSETCFNFFLVIFFGTLFHVSMSANEFRMSLFYYLLIFCSSFVVFQMAAYSEWVHPFGALHTIQPPRETRKHWA